MDAELTKAQWQRFMADGYLRLPGGAAGSRKNLEEAVHLILQAYPYGFADPKYYTGTKPRPLTDATARYDGRILVPYIGFMDSRILAPLANPYLHELLERIVGKDFYLSNTWYQEVPPGASRLGYHKDTRGSISFNILLDEIGPSMGSTCLIPGSHVNTPPAACCFSDLHAPHPLEVDLIGSPGDLVLFSPETWHARSKNNGSYRTRRLFYNFYSRSSRDTATWAGIVDPASIEAARATFPAEYHHMFDIDPDRTRRLAAVDGTALRKWAFAKSSSGDILRDIAYAAYAYGHQSESPRHPGFMRPFTTRLTEARPYSVIEYFSKLKAIPTLKNIFVFVRDALRNWVRVAPRQVPIHPQAE